MSSVFGFDMFSKDLDRYEKNAEQIEDKLHENADKMRDRAKSIATSKGLKVTGKGVDGIISEHDNTESTIGWTSRPNFHLFFHEIGFHALDNRHGKVRLKRTSKKTGRQRIYGGRTKATYVPPTPHMRPAFEELKDQFYTDMQNEITK